MLARVGTLDDVEHLAGLDDVDLWWRALIRKAELGRDVAATWRRLLRSRSRPDAWVARAGRGAATREQPRRSGLAALALDRAVPIGSVKDVAPAFWRPGRTPCWRPTPSGT